MEPAWEVAVTGGLHAGDAVPLAPGGVVTAGRGNTCTLRLADPEVSRNHLRIERGEQTSLRDVGSRNGIISRGYRVSEAEIDSGAVFQAGETVLSVRKPLAADARLKRDDDGTVWFNRPPRIPPPDRIAEINVPAKPERPRGFHFPLATVLLPLIAAAAFYFFLPGSVYFLIFLALSPLMAIASLISDRRSGRKDHRQALKVYEEQLAEVNDRLTVLCELEEQSSREACPDPAMTLRIATGPARRLFERRPGDPDFLQLRFGVADRPVAVRLTGAPLDPPWVRSVPVAVNLTVAGVAGLAASRGVRLAIARAAITQAAALHAPHDLGIVILTGAEEAADWEWAARLPHTLPHRADFACWRLFGIGRAQSEARVAELNRMVAEQTASREARLTERPVGRHLLLVVDGARRLRDIPGLSTLLSEGPSGGVFSLCLDESPGSLPAECTATIAVQGTRGLVRVAGQMPLADVIADGISARLAAAAAAALAPLRVLGARFGEGDGLPERVRLLDLNALGPDPDPHEILRRWQAQPDGRGTRIPLGTGTAGPIEVDLKRDGPHTLIAGTSGAGKSELLQTIVAGLALANLPDALNFVLVDYKGGSAFGDCAKLPHSAGLITDLDGHLTTRALTALTAELKRRETILAAAGAKDIEDYWATTDGRLPRLVIVIDEFASLAEEVPEFVSGVVGIGMRGRSLGIHVILATQRPGGVVNAEIRANVNLRLCLRVTSTGESTDVIDSPVAARISRLHPGRAYLRTGHSDLELFQAARIGWPRSTSRSTSDTPVAAEPAGIAQLGSPRPIAAVDTDAETDLAVLVTAIQEAALLSGVTPPPGPWLPPLPAVVPAAALLMAARDLPSHAAPRPSAAADLPSHAAPMPSAAAAHQSAPASPIAATPPWPPVSAPPSPAAPPSPGASPAPVAIGLADLPAQQAQPVFTLDIVRAAPIVVGGMARSGRSTLLKTLAMGLANRHSPSDLHLYVLDYGNRALAELGDLPHTGAYVTADDPGRAERLLAMLSTEIQRRSRIGATTPHLVVLLDLYEAFLARHSDVDGTRLTDMVDTMLRTGPAVGVLPVLSMDRSGFGHRISSAVETRLVLRQAEADQAEIFGVPAKKMPKKMPPGRFIAVPAEIEVQTALPPTIARAWPPPPVARRAKRVDALPESISFDDAVKLRTANGCLLGVGGDHLGAIELDLRPIFLISGPPRSGRSTALASIVSTLDIPVVIVTPRPSPLRALGALPHVAEVLSGSDAVGDLADVLTELGEAAVIVDDAELMSDSPAAMELERVARQARDGIGLLVAAGTTEDLTLQRYRGWIAAMRKERAGILLNPSGQADGEVFDIKLPRSPHAGPPGRGLLVWRGTVTGIQVPGLDS